MQLKSPGRGIGKLYARAHADHGKLYSGNDKSNARKNINPSATSQHYFVPVFLHNACIFVTLIGILILQLVLPI